MTVTNATDLTVYYPVCYVALQVRLEEFLGDLPKEALATLAGAAGNVNWIPGDGAWLRPSEQSTAATRKSATRTFTVQTAPISATVRKNSYRQADEADITIRWSDLPLDPRAIRSIGVVIYLGTVDDQSFAASMRAGVAINESERGDTNAARTVADLLSPDNIIFSGFADEPAAHYGPDGDTLTLSCRDWTGLLLDTPVPSKVYKSSIWDVYIEDTINAVLADFEGVNGVPLCLYGFEPKTVKTGRGAFHKAGKAAKAARRSRKVKDENYWDLLTDLSVGNGLVMYADGMRFVLATPTSIYSPPQQTDTFYQRDIGKSGQWLKVTESGFAAKGRKLPGTNQTAPNPVMVYGSNIDTLDFSRRLGRVKIPGVKVVCTDSREQWEYTYPPNAHAVTLHPSGLWAKDEVRVVPVSGVSSPADLPTIAKQAFEELGRGDQTMRLETNELASFGGGNADPDLLKLRAGIPVTVLFAEETKTPDQGQYSAIGTRLAFATMSEAELLDYLKTVCKLTDESAKALAAVLKNPDTANLLCRQWYTREAVHSWNNDTGYSLKVESINYAQSRIDKVTDGAN